MNSGFVFYWVCLKQEHCCWPPMYLAISTTSNGNAGGEQLSQYPLGNRNEDELL